MPLSQIFRSSPLQFRRQNENLPADRNPSNHRLAHHILSLCTSMGVGAQSGKDDRPDALVQATSLASHADSLSKSCSYKDAEQWQRHAIDTARTGHYTSPSERDTAGALVAQLQFGLAEMQNQRSRFDTAAAELPRLIKVEKLISAQDQLLAMNVPSCDTRLRNIEHDLDQQLAHALEFVRQGDEHLKNRNGSLALRAFEHAQAINREDPGLEGRILAAQKMKSTQGHASAKTAKTGILIAVVVGVGVGGYINYRNTQANHGH